MSGDKLVIV